MAVNKVLFGTETLLDLTGDTVTADKVAEGVIFHAPDGTQQTGTLAAGGVKYATGTGSFNEDGYFEVTGLDFRPYAVGIFGLASTSIYLSGYAIADAEGAPVSCAIVLRRNTSGNYFEGSKHFVQNDAGFTIEGAKIFSQITSCSWYAIGL